MSLTHHLYTFDGKFFKDITPLVQRYQHEHTMFGPYVASFGIEADQDKMRSLYDTMLMANLQTFEDGLKVWDGYVWEIDFDALGFTRTRTMENVRNRVCVSAPDSITPSNTWYTGWLNDVESQALYGVHEYIEALRTKAQIVMIDEDGDGVYEGKHNEAGDGWVWEHDQYAQRILDDYAWPQPVYSGFSGTDKPSLSLRCLGRSVIANSVKLSDGYLTDEWSSRPDGTNLRDCGIGTFGDVDYDEITHGYGTANSSGVVSGGEWTVSQEIKRIVGVIETATGWLYDLDISMNNDALTAAGVSSQIGAVDRLRELVQIPDQKGNRYEIFMRQDGGVVYRPESTTAVFWMYPDGLKKLDRRADVGWQAYCAPIKIVDPITSLASGNLVRPERVTIANGKARFVPLQRSAVDMYLAIQDNKEWLKRIKRYGR